MQHDTRATRTFNSVMNGNREPPFSIVLPTNGDKIPVYQFLKETC